MSIEVDYIEGMSISGKAGTIRDFLEERQQDKYCKYDKYGILISYETGLVFFRSGGEIKMVLKVYEPHGVIGKDTDRHPIVAVYGHETIHLVALEDYSYVKEYTR